MPEIPRKLRDAWRQNDAIETVSLLGEQKEIEPLRPILLWCYKFILADLDESNPDHNDLEYWEDELVELCNLVNQLPNHDENVEWVNCRSCKGSGTFEPYAHIGGFPKRPCDSCSGKKGWNHPLENHKLRLWMNLVRLISNDKGWFAWLKYETGWKRSDSHGLCLWGDWGYVDFEIKYSDVKKYDGVKCGKNVPKLPTVVPLSFDAPDY